MGNKLECDSELDDSFVMEELNLSLEYEDISMESSSPNNEFGIEVDEFTPASKENLAHLEAGCFVLIALDEEYCWAEVVSVQGETISGRLHNELSITTCMIEHHQLEIAQFQRDQIKAMGCDRYCWC